MQTIFSESKNSRFDYPEHLLLFTILGGLYIGATCIGLSFAVRLFS